MDVEDENNYIELLCEKLKKLDNDNYVTEEDFKEIQKYKENKNYDIHLEVLPQPFFGNIDNPKILFLAKNPSYEDGANNSKYAKNNDITDKNLFEKKSDVSLVDYIHNLSKVNFFEKINEENKYFVNCAWYWWQTNVIGDSNKMNIDNKNVGFINLNPYHSKYYSEKTPFCLEKALFEQLERISNNQNLELIVVVWGKKTWDKFVNNYSNKYDNLDSLFNGKSLIVLNKNKRKQKNNKKYGINLNTIEKIVNESTGVFNEIYDESSLNTLIRIFKKN